ncbi:hypothetical protein AAVH_41914 [Aphelenchoides avenae]|nr:hypothetical protein AAVH_41914 [Aphelenchus avenae]
MSFCSELASTGLEPAYCGGDKCDNGVWIGLSAQQDINVFEWSDGTPVNYTNWTPELSPHNWGAATFVDLFPDFFTDHGVYSHHWDNQMLGGFRLSRAAVCKKKARS